jgi:hypothetical protein
MLRSVQRLDRVVAASVSEWRSGHPLTLAATPGMKSLPGTLFQGSTNSMVD